MNPRPVIANHKIVVLLVFLCAAIMTSVFIFYASQKPTATSLHPDLGTVFPAPRGIKPFELLTEDQKPFTQKNFHQHWSLVFFGFTHCSNVCPATLDVMKRTYALLKDKYPQLQVVLISVDPDRDTPESLAKYVRAYDPSFIGVTGKIQELRKLQSQLGVYAARENDSSSNYQVSHTSSILLINPQGKWAGLFKYGLKPEQLAQAFEQAVS